MADDRASLEEYERAEKLYTGALGYDEDNKSLMEKQQTLRRRLGKETTVPAPSDSTWLVTQTIYLDHQCDDADRYLRTSRRCSNAMRRTWSTPAASTPWDVVRDSG